MLLWSIDCRLQPFLKPLMKTATTQLMAASGEVIDKADQYEVFDDPRAVCDPSVSNVVSFTYVPVVGSNTFFPQQRSLCKAVPADVVAPNSPILL